MCYIYYILLLIMTRPSAKTQTVKEGYIFILTITTCSYLVTQQQVFCHTWQQTLFFSSSLKFTVLNVFHAYIYYNTSAIKKEKQ